jgi:hypothetical protein
MGVLLGGQLVPLVVGDGWCAEEVGHTVEKGLQEGAVPHVVTPGLLVTTTVGASVRFFLLCHVMALGLEDEDSIATVNPVSALRGGEPAGCDAVCILYWVPNNGVLDGCAIALAGGIMLEYLVEEPGVEALIDQARLNVGHLHIMGTEKFRVGGGVQLEFLKRGVICLLKEEDAPHSCVAVESRLVVHSSILARQPVNDVTGFANQEPAS